jgi:hypothetical protein
MEDKNDSDSEASGKNDVYSQDSSSDEQIYGEEVEVKSNPKQKKTLEFKIGALVPTPAHDVPYTLSDKALSDK